MMEAEEEGHRPKPEPVFRERYVGSKEELECLPIESNGAPVTEGETSGRESSKERIYTKGPAKNRRSIPRLKCHSSRRDPHANRITTASRPLGMFLLKHTYHHLLMACFLSIIVETSRLAQPFLILVIIRSKPTTKQATQYACAVGMILHNLLQACLLTYQRHLTDVISIKVKVLLNRMVYTKVPLLTKSSQTDLNVNYLSLSSDVDKLCQILPLAQNALVGTLSLIASSSVLVALYGVYSLPSLGVVLLTVLLRIYLSTYQGSCLIQAINWTRGRLLHLSELIFNFNVIKINCSENIYKERLMNEERKEFPLLHRSFALKGLSIGIGFITARLAIYITVVTLARDGNDMAFQGLLLLVSYIHTLEYYGIVRLPLGVGSLTCAVNMIQRLQDTLDGKEGIYKKEAAKNYHLDDPSYSYNNNEDKNAETEQQQLALTKAPVSYSPTERARGRRYRWIWLYFLTSGPGYIVFPIILLLSVTSEAAAVISEWWISKCRTNFTTGTDGISTGVVFNNQTYFDQLQLSSNGTLVRHIFKPLAADLAPYTGLSLAYIVFELISMVLLVYVILYTLYKLLLMMRSALLCTKSSRLTNMHSGAILEAFGSDFHYLFETGASVIYINFVHIIRVVSYLIFACVIYPWVSIPTIPYIIGLILLKIYTRDKIQHNEEKEHELQEVLLKGFDSERQPSWETSVKRHLAMEKHKWHNLARTRTILSLKINLFTSLYCACVMLQLVPCSQKLSTRGVAGLIYVYMSMLIIYVQDVVADTNTFANCLKRIQAVASLPSEVIGSEGAWCDWPSSGSVNFTHVKLPGCVHKAAIECDIPPGEKVGFLAKEGCCRHGFVSAILSLEDHIGSARIDNLDTAAVNVHTLRTSVTLIHTNLLMKGITLRHYLDPKEEFSNERISEVFEQLGLRRNLASVSLEDDLGDIGYRLDEVSLNTLCVARALLHCSKVVVVWEDFIGSDRSVDSTLQYIIRQHLPDATRIKVTPSVRSVITCDSIMVIDDGKMEIYPSAWRFLVYRNGVYDQLVKEVGLEEAARIKAVTLGFYRERTAMDTIEEIKEEEEGEDLLERILEEEEDDEDEVVHV